MTVSFKVRQRFIKLLEVQQACQGVDGCVPENLYMLSITANPAPGWINLYDVKKPFQQPKGVKVG